MLSVQTNNAAMTVLKNLNIAAAGQNQSMARLSSGFKIMSASDGAAEFSIASKLSAQGMALKAASANASQATAMVKMADAAVNEIQNMANRLKVLATQAASSNNSTQLATLEAERVSLEGQITKLAQGANYNGVKLLDGTAGVQTFQVGATANAYDQVTANMANDYTATGLGLGALGAGFTTATTAQTYIATIDAAINTITTRRADLGATTNALGYVQANLATSIEQIASSVSVIKDADMAAEMANMTKGKILTQASTAMLAQANQASQQILSLFR